MAATDREVHSLASFRERFAHAPEDDVLVQAVLDEAASRTPPRVWRDRTRAAHGYLAAHLLGMDPHGRDARIQNDDGQTTYGILRERMEAELGPAVTPRTT